MKQTPQNALKDFNMIALGSQVSLVNRDELKYSLYEALIRLEANPFSQNYRGKNLYALSLEKLCQKKECLEDIFNSTLNHLDDDILYSRFKLTLKFIPKKLHEFEHVLMAISANKIHYLNDFIEAGYDIYQAKGSIVIPIWCQLLKKPEKFDQVINQFRLKPKDWTNDLIERAISFGSYESLIYLSEKNMYDPKIVHQYLNEWNQKDCDLMKTIEQLDIIFEKKQLEKQISSETNEFKTGKLKI